MSTLAPSTHPDIEAIRAAFPALGQETIFLENAGGSQVPEVVANAIRDYMLNTYVQLGAGYPLSQYCTELVDRAHRFIGTFMNAGEAGKVILGPSSTALCMMLAGCYRDRVASGDEIVIAECGHETNVGPWVRLAEATGAEVRWWRVDRETTSTTLEGLAPLLSERTRFVCLPHVSNLLGEIIDVAAVVEAAHAAGARVVADGVAYAPHRAIDASGWGVDYYFYSAYKVYGPHMAALFGRHDALAEIEGPNHFFIPKDDIPYKFEPGGVSHEAAAGLLALGQYLRFLAGADADANEPCSRETVESANAVMTSLETPLQQRVIEYLRSKPGVRIVGPDRTDPETRVGTISFVHESKSSGEIARRLNGRNIGVRNGHMYAWRLCEALGLDPEDGVVRVSLVHYNDARDFDRLTGALDDIL